MAKIERLIETNQLKTTLLTKLLKRKQEPYLLYDREADELLLLFISPENMTVVHYVDDQNVALLYQPDSLEIVGFQVEAFHRSFLPEHSSIKRVWSFCDSGIHMESMDDLVITFEQRKQAFAEEIVTIAEPWLNVLYNPSSTKKERIPA